MLRSFDKRIGRQGDLSPRGMDKSKNANNKQPFNRKNRRKTMSAFKVRQGKMEDLQAAHYICLKTGNHGADGERMYQDDPDALGRIFVGPYLAFEPEHSLMLEDNEGICGYAFAAFDSKGFYSVLLEKSAVKHIGWDDHIVDPVFIRKVRFRRLVLASAIFAFGFIAGAILF